MIASDMKEDSRWFEKDSMIKADQLPDAADIQARVHELLKRKREMMFQFKSQALSPARLRRGPNS